MTKASASGERPKSPAIAHIGIAVRDLSDSVGFFRDILGLADAPIPLEDADGATIVGLVAGESLVELLQTKSPESPIGKFLAKRGPGIHHVCFAVDDLDGTLDRCRRAGIRLIDEVPRPGAEGKRIAFVHPGSTGGVLVELMEN